MKTYFNHILLLLSVTTLLFACDSKSPSAQAPVESLEETPEKKANAPEPLSKMPYTISVNKSATQPTDAYGIQSMAHGFDGTHLMMLGGRTQGFHGTANAGGVFESRFSNTQIAILNPVTGSFKSMDLPTAHKDHLQSTNMEYYYDGTYLICIGGYGAFGDATSPETFKTFPYITAINFSKAVTAITNNNAANLAASILSLKDERMRVTGGGLEKIGDYYYLCFGQNYDTIYIGGITGEYTEEVRKFKLAINDDALTISDYKAYKDPSGKTGTASQYHRRDLNVCSAIRPDGSEGITALGGVFTKDDGGWVYPILVDNKDTTSTVEVNKGLEQKLSQYECSLVSFYDPTNKAMFHTLMGGISYYWYDNGVLKPSTITNWLPFTSSITTIVQNAAGMQEFPQPEDQSLPKLLGSDAAFIPNPSLSYMNDANTIIDLSKLDNNGSPIQVGWIFGGIEATAGQSDEFNPTYANKVLYDVMLTFN